MLRYNYHLVATFTLTSVIVIYVIDLDLTMEVTLTPGLTHSHGLVVREIMRNREEGFSGFISVSHDMKNKTIKVQRHLIKKEHLQGSIKP